MASEIRVDKINSLSGVGTVTLSPTGVDIAGITTAATLRATTGIVTSLTAGSLTSLGAVSGTTGTFSGAVSGTTGTFSAAVSGTTGTFSAAVSGTTGTFSGDIKTTAATVNIKSGSSINTNSDTSAHGALHKNTNSGEFAVVSGGTGGNNHLSFYTSASAAPTEKVRITSDGHFGIGDTTPAEILTIRDATPRIRLEDSDTTNAACQFVGDNASVLIQADTAGVVADSTISFAIDGGERLRINSSGDFGLGTTSPAVSNALFGGAQRTLHVSGSVAPMIRIQSTTSGQADLLLQAGNSGADAYIANAASNGDIVFSTSNGGTQGSKLRIRHDSGICFGTDNAAANALDDYEEGTWTPTNSIGLTLTNSNPAYYLKIGKMVMIQFDVSFSGASDTSQCGAIQSLPFNAENTTNHFAQSPLPYISTNTGNNKLDTSHMENLLVFIAPGDDKITIYSWVTSSLAARSLLVGRRIRHQMIYKAA